MSTKITDSICAHDDTSDLTEVSVEFCGQHVEITLPGEIGINAGGSIIDEGYTRTVRVEVRQGIMKVLVYGAHRDEPMNIEVTLDGEPREVL